MTEFNIFLFVAFHLFPFTFISSLISYSHLLLPYLAKVLLKQITVGATLHLLSKSLVVDTLAAFNTML